MNSPRLKAVWQASLGAILLSELAVARAQVELVPDEQPQAIFAGRRQDLRVVFRNPANQEVTLSLRTRFYQATSATLVPLEETKTWKNLTVLPKQTIIETISLTIPAVRAATSFRLHWLAETGKLVGRTELVAYPEDLLRGLSAMAGGVKLGVLDPERRLAPILTQLKVEFVELATSEEFAAFRGRLAIVGPLDCSSYPSGEFCRLIVRKAKQSCAVIWFRSAKARLVGPEGAVVAIGGHGGAKVVLAPSSTLTGLAESPQAQLNLLGLGELALSPDTLGLVWNEP